MKKFTSLLLLCLAINLTKAQINQIQKGNIQSKHLAELPVASKKAILPAQKAKQVTYINDSIKYWFWNGQDAWDIAYRFRYINDNKDRVVSEILNYWGGNSWINYFRYNYTYDAFNTVSTSIYQEWDGSAWVNNTAYILTRGGPNNNQINYAIRQWDGSAWVNYIQYLYGYDSNNNLVSNLEQNWNDTIWKDNVLSLYTYDNNNRTIKQINQKWNGTTWLNLDQYFSTYTSNNYLESYLQQKWRDGEWANFINERYTYDNYGYTTSYLIQDWLIDAWRYTSHNLYEYDNNYNLATDLKQEWGDSAWVDYEKYKLTYDEQNYRTSATHIVWDKEWINYDSAHYYFHIKTSAVSKINTNGGEVTIYPNPITNSGIIAFDNAQKNSTVKIIDLAGKLIKTIVFSGNQLRLEKEDMKAGIYFVQITDENKNVITRKLVLQ